MTLKTFIDKWNNKYLDFDKAYGFQCVDLMRQYCKDVLGISAYTLPAVTYAYQVFKNFPDSGTKEFTKVYNNPNDPKQIPPQGAIMFFKPWVIGVTGIAGHVCLNWQAYQNIDKFISFDQNWPTNSSCHLQSHSYKGVWGWLIKK